MRESFLAEVVGIGTGPTTEFMGGSAAVRFAIDAPAPMGHVTHETSLQFSKEGCRALAQAVFVPKAVRITVELVADSTPDRLEHAIQEAFGVFYVGTAETLLVSAARDLSELRSEHVEVEPYLANLFPGVPRNRLPMAAAQEISCRRANAPEKETALIASQAIAAAQTGGVPKRAEYAIKELRLLRDGADKLLSQLEKSGPETGRNEVREQLDTEAVVGWDKLVDEHAGLVGPIRELLGKQFSDTRDPRSLTESAAQETANRRSDEATVAREIDINPSEPGSRLAKAFASVTKLPSECDSAYRRGLREGRADVARMVAKGLRAFQDNETEEWPNG